MLDNLKMKMTFIFIMLTIVYLNFQVSVTLTKKSLGKIIACMSKMKLYLHKRFTYSIEEE